MNTHLCIDDLVQVTGGNLRLAAMPPRDGEFSHVRRIVLSAGAISGGDVYWRLDRRPGDIEQAFLQGAVGVVTAGQPVEPWPGRFCLVVDDPVAGLARLVEWLAAYADESLAESSELKVLQLCGAHRADIYRLTCGHEVNNHATRRCQRHAA